MFVKRGVLILEHGIGTLDSSLKSRNFFVHTISLDAADGERVYDMLIHRVLITQHSKEFIEAAVIHEFGIIDIAQATKEPEKLADIVSREWLAGSIRVRQPFLARIGADGSVTVCAIED